MKKKILLAGILSCLVFGSVPVDAATFNQDTVLKSSVTVGDIWNRDVGDGVDTFEFKDNDWYPKSSTSLRRKVAFQEEIIVPNQKEIAEKEAKIQEYVDEAKSNKDAFNHYSDDQVMLFKSPDGIVYRIPKVIVPPVISEISNNFYVNEKTVPKFLDVLGTKDSGTSPSTTSSETKSAESQSSTVDSSKISDSKEKISSNEKKSSEETQRVTSDVTSTTATDTNQNSTTENDSAFSNTSTAETYTLKVKQSNYEFDVKPNEKLTKNELLDFITYTNNAGQEISKNNIEVTIATSYVYVVKESEVYHYDLDALLGTSTRERISVMTQAQAENKGLREAQGVSDKSVRAVSLSLPGKYTVTYSDGKNEVKTTITVKGDTGTSSSSSTTKSTTNTSKKTSIAKQYPKTGAEASTQYAWIGAGLFATAAAFLFKKKQ